MAVPTIIVDSATGSDTTASGAGPGTAISGSTGRTRNTASQLHFGFFGATDDFSGVATDGTAALFASIATAGQRNFSSIAAVKNTRETGSDAAITATTAVLVVGSTTGWTAGDVLKVAGAGAAGADLYSTILTVDSGIQATLNDNAGTTVAGAAWENPKQVTLTTGEGLNTGTTNTAWAIGGKRASLGAATSLKFFSNNAGAGDCMPGWTVEMQSGHAETLSNAIVMRRAGDTTTGPITLRGANGAGTVPLLTFNFNSVAIQLRGAMQRLKDFEIQNSNATKTASIGIQGIDGADAMGVDNVKISHSTNKFWRGIVYDGQSGNGAVTIANCEIGYTASNGVRYGGVCNPKLMFNFVHDTAGDAVFFTSSGTINGTFIYGNIIYNTTGYGLVFDSTTGSNSVTVIAHNTIDLSSLDNFRIVSAGSWFKNAAFFNNIASNSSGGYGFNFVSATFTANYKNGSGPLFSGNNTYNNSSGAYNPSGYGTDDPATDPSYTSASGGNFAIGSALAGKGIPIGGTTKIGTGSSTYSYVDPGASQIQAASASGVGGIIGDGATW